MWPPPRSISVGRYSAPRGVRRWHCSTMDLSVLVDELGISNDALSSKAAEYVRVSKMRVRNLGDAEICRNVVCLHLASTL